VQFIGVAALDSSEAMEDFVGITGVGIFPNIDDQDGAIWASYGIGYQPAFVFLSAEGERETFASLGFDDIQRHIDELF
jgi:hypothetical protein